MPHLILECSANVPDKPNLQRLFHELHQTLAAAGPFTIQDMKSRYREPQDFLVSDGARNEGFIHLTLAILSGRDAEVKRSTSEKLLAFLEQHFPLARASGCYSFTVEVREMERGSCSKIPLTNQFNSR